MTNVIIGSCYIGEKNIAKWGLSQNWKKDCNKITFLIISLCHFFCIEFAFSSKGEMKSDWQNN
jgi:hypothetical protein